MLSRLCVAWALTAFCALPCAAEEQPRPFTVADSIAMTRLVASQMQGDASVGSAFQLAPDGRRFFVLTRKGNLQTGRNEYSLWLHEVAEVVAFINSRSSEQRPQPLLLVRLETSSNKPAIGAVKWNSAGTALAFIGRSDGELAQVYQIDLGTRALRRISNHATDVVTFAFSESLGKLAYCAYAPPRFHENESSYVVAGETDLHDYTNGPRGTIIRDIEYLIADLATGAIKQVALEPDVLPRSFSMSPNGRWAVIATTVRQLPSDWLTYQFLRPQLDQWTRSLQYDVLTKRTASQNAQSADTDLLRNDAFGSVAPWILQYWVIDLETGTARTLLDAPVTSEPSITWISERRAMLGAVHLKERGDGEVTVEIDVSTGRFEIVPAAQMRNRVRRAGGSRAPNIALEVTQGINTPPELAATDLRSGTKRAVTNLNPQLQGLTLGRVEQLKWKDRFGTEFVGGLLYPPGYDTAGRYPVVIQTYGFDPEEFLIDGPGGFASAYAARAIANKDILVLQAPLLGLSGWQQAGETWRYADDGEMPRFTAMLEGAIDALVARNLIDRDRVGVIGFSREGMRLHYALTFSGYPIAAATIADSAAATPFCYSMAYGYSYPGMLEFESREFMGAPFWGEGIATWLERSPAFHLDRMHTPLRVESYGQRSSCYWDTFAILKRHRRPVEMVIIPDGGHLLEAPRARYASQQANVDWFAFWLRDEEDPAPEKAAQYVRWRELREQRRSSVVSQ